MCHEMQRDSHLIDFTLPDAMQNLRDIVDTQCKRQGIVLKQGEKVRNGFIKEVMAVYSGRPGYADNTMRNVCGIVVKLSSSLVREMRLLLTEECEAYCEELGSRRPFGMDTRVYKKLLSSQSLKGVNKGVKIFLGGGMNDKDRINVIHRLRFLARERECFRSFSATEVDKQCQCVLAAQKEVSKFDEFLAEEDWPAELENLRRNILQTTLLDRDIAEHVAPGKELLPILVDAYKKATGSHGSQKLGLFMRRQALGNHSDAVIEDLDQVVVPGIGNEGINVKFEASRDTADASQGREKGTSGTDCEVSKDPDDVLKKLGVRVERTCLLEYERNSLDVERSVDCIVADPFQRIPCPPTVTEGASGQVDSLVDEKGIKLYLQCLRRLLVPGGHVFVFLNWKHLSQWSFIASDCSFETICEPFLVVKDAKRVQKLTLKGLQNVYEPALVLRRPGKHPNGFIIDRKSPYENLPQCKMPRWCNVIDGVPPPAERLTFKPTKVLVRPTEKPCSLIIELLQTLCPENGRVLDPHAGTLTTGLACIATKRSCVLLETDEHCLFHAVPRLCAFAEERVLVGGSGSKTSEESCENDLTNAKERLSRLHECPDGKYGDTETESEASQTEDEGSAASLVEHKEISNIRSRSFSFVSSEDDGTSSEEQYETKEVAAGRKRLRRYHLKNGKRRQRNSLQNTAAILPL